MGIPLSLYIHIPWCVQKCPYCDFNSHASQGDLPEHDYVSALLDDLDWEIELTGGRALHSIFLGGGTPSLFSGQAIERLLDGIRTRIPLQTDCEITLEANPGTAEARHFSAYRAAGVNRLSIGVQSFNPVQLSTLGRIHNSDEARQAITLAQQSGFERINIDLMHGLPRQTVPEALDDLRTAIDSGVTHVSWYQLTIEPNTVFYTAPPILPAEPVLLDILESGQALLGHAGFGHYEVSAWAHPGQQSRHNTNYWTFGDYIGIGAGAHGKLSLADGRIIRRWKTRLPSHYLDRQKPFLAGESAIATKDLPIEFLMNALRLRDGVESSLFETRTGCSRQSIAAALEALREQGLMDAGPQLKTTPQGFWHLDTVLQAFM